MQSSPKSYLWNEIFKVYYDAYFEEMLNDCLITKWQWVDYITSVLVAITASGSAISGLALWSNEGWKLLWAGLAIASALLSIVHTALGVSKRIKDYVDIRNKYRTLRTKLETLQNRMPFVPNWTKREIHELLDELAGYRNELSETSKLTGNDILRTKKFEYRVKAELDEKIADKIEKNVDRGNQR